MSVIYFLIGLALLVAGSFLGLFFWAVKAGQYTDMEGPARRILFEDGQAYREGAKPSVKK